MEQVNKQPSYKYNVVIEDDRIIYYYKEKPYKIMEFSKMKVGKLWIKVIIYECQYHNTEGMVWVREESEFLSIFTVKQNHG